MNKFMDDIKNFHNITSIHWNQIELNFVHMKTLTSFRALDFHTFYTQITDIKSISIFLVNDKFIFIFLEN